MSHTTVGNTNYTDEEPDRWCLSWIGREQRIRQRIACEAVAALSATLDKDCSSEVGNPLPPGWQWLFFNPVGRASELGPDGHIKRTPQSFLPPIDLPRRMWAGSRIRYLHSIEVGAEVERSSRIERIMPKAGKTGQMCFVTVAHVYRQDGRECISEQQDIVYRDSARASLTTTSAQAAKDTLLLATWQRAVVPDSVLLFRYSALTFNGHRIHYDRPYARDVEHYRDLVVQGPLTATLLQTFAVSLRPEQPLATFDFRGMQPLFVDESMTLCADETEAGALLLRAVNRNGDTGMEAVAHFGEKRS